jgi:hypothetical protein
MITLSSLPDEPRQNFSDIVIIQTDDNSNVTDDVQIQPDESTKCIIKPEDNNKC